MSNETPATEITNVAPAGWYTAPGGDSTTEQYWDGQSWTDQTRPTPTDDKPAPSQADIEAEARAREGVGSPEPPAPVVHDASATVTAPVTAAAPSAPAAPAAPEPPAPVVTGTTAAPAPSVAAIPAGPAPSTDAAPSSSRVMDAGWPFKGYSGPQAYEAENPPTLTQNHLMLSPGMTGPEVVELAALLGQLGYGSSITSGQNPHAIFDDSLVRALGEFGREYGVEEDPAVLRARTPDTVGPWTWEALVRAVHKKSSEPVNANA